MKKKIVSIAMLLLLALVLVACDSKGNNLEQEEADFAEMLLLVDISVPTGDRGSVVNSFSVPVAIAGGGTLTWTSSNEAHAKFGVVGGQNLIVVTRPASDAADATITVTGTLTWTGPSETVYSDKVDFQIRVLKMPVSAVATIADVRTGEYATGDSVKFEDVVIIHVASNGISIFDPETKHSLFVYGSDIAGISNVGDKGDIVGEYAVNFDSPQLTGATFTKASEVELEDLLAMAMEIDVADYWLEPGSSAEVVLAAKQDPEINAFVKFTANVKDHPEWASNSTTNYTTVLHDPADETKYVRSYYGGMKHSDLVTLSGTDNVTIYAVAYTIRDDRVKPSTIEGVLPSYEIFVIHYDATLTDEQKVTLDMSNIPLQTVFAESATVTLQTTGAHGSAISWVTSDATLFNVETGAVTVTPNTTNTVKVTATITNGSVTQTREFNITLGKMTIDQIYTKESTDIVFFDGIVTGFSPYTSFSNYDDVWMEDETGAIRLYRAKLPKDIKIGDKYTVLGELDVYNGGYQIKDATFEFVSKDNTVKASEVLTDATYLVQNNQSKRITYSGVVKSISTTGREMIVTVGEDEFRIYTPGDSALINTHILTGTVGQKVNVKDVHIVWNNGVRITPSQNEQIEFIFTDADKLDAAKDALVAQFDDKLFNMEAPIELPAKGLHDVAITWEATTAIVDGKWITVTADTTVTLKATLTIGTEEPVVVDLDVTVKFLADPSAPVTVVMSNPGGETINTKAETNYAEFLGLDPTIFTVEFDKGSSSSVPAIRAEGGWRLYYNASGGNNFTIKVASGYVIDSIILEISTNKKATEAADITFTVNEQSFTETGIDGNIFANSGDGTNWVVLDPMTINSSTVVITNANTTNVQLWVWDVIITYRLAS